MLCKGRHSPAVGLFYFGIPFPQPSFFLAATGLLAHSTGIVVACLSRGLLFPRPFGNRVFVGSGWTELVSVGGCKPRSLGGLHLPVWEVLQRALAAFGFRA